MLILLVDDDPATVFVLNRLLVSRGHEVDICADGAQAVARLRSKAYAVLLTDLVMPGMSGLDLVREARGLRGGLRCLIVTGHPRPREGDEGVTWLRKPLDIDALLSALDAIARTEVASATL